MSYTTYVTRIASDDASAFDEFMLNGVIDFNLVTKIPSNLDDLSTEDFWELIYGHRLDIIMNSEMRESHWKRRFWGSEVNANNQTVVSPAMEYGADTVEVYFLVGGNMESVMRKISRLRPNARIWVEIASESVDHYEFRLYENGDLTVIAYRTGADAAEAADDVWGRYYQKLRSQGESESEDFKVIVFNNATVVETPSGGDVA